MKTPDVEASGVRSADMKAPDEGPVADDGARDEIAADAEVLAASRRHTRRSFALAALGAAAGYGFYQWVGRSRPVEMLPEPLRRALEADAGLSRAVFGDRAMAPTYPVSRAENLRVNGVVGLKEALVAESWRLQMVGVEGAASRPEYVPDVTAWEYRYTKVGSGEDRGHDTKVRPKAEVRGAVEARADTAVKMAPEPMVATVKAQEQMPTKRAREDRAKRGKEEAGHSRSTLPEGTPGLLLTMGDIQKLPKCELVTQFKCIEGWSQVVRWRGVRFAELIEAYPPARKADGSLPRYVYMETPEGDYYVGYDLHVCQHPQTLLVTEMGGEALTQFHGAPLRLHTPSKYGYKQIKRIGLIAYTDVRPDDYWTRLGYDWYAGL